MTLAQLANFICGKVNQTEAEDIAACKGFIRQRHEMIYQDQLWRDSVGEYVQTLSPDDYAITSNWLPAKGILLLPPDIERVLAVRTDTRALNVRSREYFYRRDFDSFAQNGQAGDFVRLRPCIWETEDAIPLLAVRSDASDAANSVIADLADSDNVGITRYTKLLDEAEKLLGTSERIETLQKPTTTGSVAIQGSTGMTVVNNSGLAGTFSTSAGELHLANGATGIVDSDSSVTTVNFVSDDDSLLFALTDLATPFGTATASAVEITYDDTPAALTTILTLAAADTAARKRQRIRLIAIPTAALTIRVLAKLVCPALSADGDSPALTNVDNCLIAFGQSDMLERERQYAKAASKAEEGVALLEQLKRTEVIQEAHNQCIQPAGGYGGDYDTRGGGFSF